MPLLNCLTVVK